VKRGKDPRLVSSKAGVDDLPIGIREGAITRGVDVLRRT
jgi:hypothetical protein